MMVFSQAFNRELLMNHTGWLAVISGFVLLETLAGSARAGEPAAYPETGTPYLAVYRWAAANRRGGAAANVAFARWLNRPVVWAEDFAPTERDFAAKHQKRFAIPEWGVNRRPDGHGGLDNVFFIEQMQAFIASPANRVYFHCYFDVQAPEGAHQVFPGISGEERTEFPESAKRFQKLFGLASR